MGRRNSDSAIIGIILALFAILGYALMSIFTSIKKTSNSSKNTQSDSMIFSNTEDENRFKINTNEDRPNYKYNPNSIIEYNLQVESHLREIDALFAEMNDFKENGNLKETNNELRTSQEDFYLSNRQKLDKYIDEMEDWCIKSNEKIQNTLSGIDTILFNPYRFNQELLWDDFLNNHEFNDINPKDVFFKKDYKY